MPEALCTATDDKGLRKVTVVGRLPDWFRDSKNPSPSLTPSQGHPHSREQILPRIKLRTENERYRHTEEMESRGQCQPGEREGEGGASSATAHEALSRVPTSRRVKSSRPALVSGQAEL